jgi:hypothetical protein
MNLMSQIIYMQKTAQWRQIYHPSLLIYLLKRKAMSLLQYSLE